MSTIVVGGAVVVVCVGGYYRYLRGSPSDEELKPMDEEVNQWQLKLPGIGTTLQMARLAMIVYDDDMVDEFNASSVKMSIPVEGKLKEDPNAYLENLKKKAGEDTEMWFYKAAGDTEAAVTFSPENKRCTVIFRGTESFWDAIADAKFIKKQLGPDGTADGHQGVLVHSGFRGQYYGEVMAMTNDGDVSEHLRTKPGELTAKSLETALFQKVEKVLTFAPDTELFVTGHSLGGALSVLCGIRLALKFPNKNVQVINFGCPKVGNAAFAKLVNTTPNLCVQRVVHKRDIITRVPNLDFNHVGHTIQIDEAEDVKPRAHKWHAGLHAMTNWNPMMGRVSHHLMAGYLKALNSHGEGKKPWVDDYNGSS